MTTKVLRENKTKGGKTIKAILLSVLALIALVAVAGCARAPEPMPKLTFEVQLHVDAEGQTVVELGLHNTGEGDFAGDEDFCGVMEIRHEEGTPRARMDVLHLNQQLAPGEAVEFERCMLKLAPGAYNLVWGAPAYGSTVVDFSIVERHGKLTIGEQARGVTLKIEGE